MRNIKIIASDLDGTLLNSNSEVSAENLEAIRKLAEKGVFFVPATGRSLSEIPKAIADIPEIRYIISSNGAAINDRKTGKRLLFCITNDKVKRILDILYAFDTHIVYRRDGLLYVDAYCQKKEDFVYYNICKAHINVIENYGIHLTDFKEKAYQADEVEGIAAFIHDKSRLSECRKLIEEIDGISVVETWENLEVLNSCAGKGNAILSLADEIGADRCETMALGDSDNDKSMIKSAGLGLAVANANDDLKAIADDVICSNDEHIVKYVLENYLDIE